MRIPKKIREKITEKLISSWLEFIGLLVILLIGKNIKVAQTFIFYQGVLCGIGFMLIFLGKDIAKKMNLKK